MNWKELGQKIKLKKIINKNRYKRSKNYWDILKSKKSQEMEESHLD